ncbi:Cupredoxin [Lineolata rhizophorae]|uniref:Cupredoxin n=1 Tax=Lineolata rhizophorae TaxID=578093 RepID=A0A6A6NTY0_9PEZI|nr:Cupredoxin [Lineolata rhizophorae]
MSTSASGNQIIKVGQDGLTFEPDTLTVEEGDMVEFHFWPMNHSVSMSTFDEPCVPASDDAFWSGFMPVEEGMGDDIFVVQINSTDPIWFYCATGRHCENGMVGVINPP